jgi:hypothetical protein
VLVGDRQEGRETDEHVTHVPPEASLVLQALRNQLRHGSYKPSTLYGDGLVSGRIADGLVELEPYVQKRLHYIYDQEAEDQHGHARTWNHNRTRRVERHPSEERRVVAR